MLHRFCDGFSKPATQASVSFGGRWHPFARHTSRMKMNFPWPWRSTLPTRTAFFHGAEGPWRSLLERNPSDFKKAVSRVTRRIEQIQIRRVGLLMPRVIFHGQKSEAITIWGACSVFNVFTMYLPCIYHVFTMYLPCVYHVFTMYLPCIYHVFTMYLPCILPCYLCT